MCKECAKALHLKWVRWNTRERDGVLALNNWRGTYLTPEVENSAWKASRMCLSSLILDTALLESYLVMKLYWRWLWSPLQVIVRLDGYQEQQDAAYGAAALASTLSKRSDIWWLLSFPGLQRSRCVLALAFDVLLQKMKVLNQMIALLLSHAHSLWATSSFCVWRSTVMEACLRWCLEVKGCRMSLNLFWHRFDNRPLFIPGQKSRTFLGVQSLYS